MADLVLISEAEKRFIADGVAQDLRNDGRKREQVRAFRVETGIVPQATGSAKVCLGNTHVIACLKAEIGSPDPARPDEGRLEIAVDCSPTAAPEFRGRGGEELEAELAAALHSSLTGRERPKAGRTGRAGVLGGAKPEAVVGTQLPGSRMGERREEVGSGASSALDMGALCLAAGRTCWVLYLDALVLSLDGNLLGAISLSIKAALQNAVLPQVEVTMGDAGEDPELEIVEEGGESNRLDVSRVPLIVQLAQIGRQYVADATAEEEAVASSSLWASVRASGHLTGAGQQGPCGVAPSLLAEMLAFATHAAGAWHSELEREVADSEARRFGS